MRYILVAVLVVALLASFAPIAPAAQQQAAQKTKGADPYLWDPFATWIYDTCTWIVTGKYQPDEDEPLPGAQRIRRVDAFNHGYNPWYW